jgi:hypothetical protein
MRPLLRDVVSDFSAALPFWPQDGSEHYIKTGSLSIESREVHSKVPFVLTVRASVYEIKLDAITIMPGNAPTMRNPYIALPPRTSLTALNRQQLIVTGRWKVTCGGPAPVVY